MIKACPVDTACTEVESYLAARASAADAAAALLNVPNTHPMRWEEKDGRMVDSVFDMAARVAKGVVLPAELRAFLGDLRDGAAAMVATGWYATLRGGGR